MPSIARGQPSSRPSSSPSACDGWACMGASVWGLDSSRSSPSAWLGCAGCSGAVASCPWFCSWLILVLPTWAGARRAPGRTDVRATGATRGRRRRVRRAVSAGGVGTRPVVVHARKRVDGETGPCRSVVAVVAARLDGCAALVVAQHVDELVLRLVRVAGQPELLGPVAQLVDRPVLVALGVPASAPHGVLALRGRGVRDPGGLLLRRALVAQRLVHVGLLDRRRGVLAWHGSSFSRALDRTPVPLGAVGSGEG